MTFLIDRFEIISNNYFETDIKKINYIENYLNDNFICHHDLIRTHKISTDEVSIVLKNYLRKQKLVFSRLIRLEKINIDNIVDFVNETKIKFNFIKTLCKNDYPDDDELIFNIIIFNPYIDKLIDSCIREGKSILDYIKMFKQYNRNDYNQEIELCMIEKISSYITDNIQFIDESFFNDKKYIRGLFELDMNLNYLIKTKIKYEYLPEKVFDSLIKIILNNINDCMKYDKKNYLNYFQINSVKFDYIFKIIKSFEKKNEIRDVLLFYTPDNFIELYDFMNILIKMNISDKESIIDIFIKNNKKLINEESIKFITNKIDYNIKNNICNKSNYLFIKNLKFNQDLIIADLTLYLMKRYIYFPEFNAKKENDEYNIIEDTLPKNILYKYMKVIKDINHKGHYQVNDMIFKYISKPVWDLDYNKGHYKVNDNDTHTHYKTQLFLHLGSIETEFQTNKGDYNIRMLPIHNHIIKNPNTFKTKLVDYSEDYLNRIFKQLLDNDILILNFEDKYIINNNYEGGDLDLIKLLNDNDENENNIIEAIKKEVNLERKEIIMANINSLLKTSNEYMDIQIVYDTIKDKLQLYFDITDDYFKIVVEEMANKDYIDYNIEQATVKKLIY